MTEEDVGKSTVAGAPWAKVTTDIPRITEEGLQERRRRNANKKAYGDVLVTGLNIFNARFIMSHMFLFFFSLVNQGVVSLNDLPLAQSAVDKLANDSHDNDDDDNNDKTA